MNSVPKIAVTALAVLVLASCGSTSTPAKTTKSGSSASASASPSSTVAPAGGSAMSGTGYTYHLPNAWEDISAQLKRSQPGIDTGGRAKPATPPFTANMNTLTTPSRISGAPSKSDLDALAAQIKQEVATLAPTVATKPQTTIAGAPAVHQEGRANSSGTKFYLVQYFAIYKGNNYGLTFAFPSSTNAAGRGRIVEPVLASWKWS
ncbi:MAG: hypothetical protein ABI873_19935 [Marmoricola sp.]